MESRYHVIYENISDDEHFIEMLNQYVQLLDGVHFYHILEMHEEASNCIKQLGWILAYLIDRGIYEFNDWLKTSFSIIKQDISEIEELIKESMLVSNFEKISLAGQQKIDEINSYASWALKNGASFLALPTYDYWDYRAKQNNIEERKPYLAEMHDTITKTSHEILLNIDYLAQWLTNCTQAVKNSEEEFLEELSVIKTEQENLSKDDLPIINQEVFEYISSLNKGNADNTENTDESSLRNNKNNF